MRRPQTLRATNAQQDARSELSDAHSDLSDVFSEGNEPNAERAPVKRPRRADTASTRPAAKHPRKKRMSASKSDSVSEALSSNKSASSDVHNRREIVIPVIQLASSRSPSPLSSSSDVVAELTTEGKKESAKDDDSLSSLATSEGQDHTDDDDNNANHVDFQDLNSNLINDAQYTSDTLLYSTVKLPYIVMFCNRFSSFLDLRAFTLCELERELAQQGNFEAPVLFTDIALRLLDSVPDKYHGTFRNVLLANWEQAVVDYLNATGRHDIPMQTEKNPILQLPLASKIYILYNLCESVFTDILNIFDHIRIFPNSMRVEPIGEDHNKALYWYFGDNRLYMESTTAGTSSWQLCCHNYQGWKQQLRKQRALLPRHSENATLRKSLARILDVFARKPLKTEEGASKGFKMSRQFRMDRLHAREAKVLKILEDEEKRIRLLEQRRHEEDLKRKKAAQKRKNRERRVQEHEWAKKAERELISRLKHLSRTYPDVKTTSTTKNKRDYTNGRWEITDLYTLRFRVDAQILLDDTMKNRLRQVVNALRFHTNANCVIVATAMTNIEEEIEDDMATQGFDEVYRKLLLDHYKNLYEFHQDVCHILYTGFTGKDPWSSEYKKVTDLQFYYIQKLADRGLLYEKCIKRKQRVTRSGRRVHGVYGSDSSSSSSSDTGVEDSAFLTDLHHNQGVNSSNAELGSDEIRMSTGDTDSSLSLSSSP